MAMIHHVCMKQSMIDDCMDMGLRKLGWTEEQCYDYLIHKIFDIPREGCETCPSLAERARLEATLTRGTIPHVPTAQSWQ